jgi:16S rRNA (guanine527-N7)-methyltransferase
VPLSTAESEHLRRGAHRFGIELSNGEVDSFGRYLDLLLQWREHARLIARTQSRLNIIDKHIVDSLAVLEHVRDHRLLDVGSGAGLPGVPIAIVRATIGVTLVEPNRRKANFLRDVVRQLGLANVDVRQSRVEELAKSMKQQPLYQTATSRAVWTLSELLKRVDQLLLSGGLLIAMKGPDPEAEIASSDLTSMRFTLEAVQRYQLTSGERRALVLLRRQQRST